MPDIIDPFYDEPYDENPTHCSACGKESGILLLGGEKYTEWFCLDCYGGRNEHDQ